MAATIRAARRWAFKLRAHRQNTGWATEAENYGELTFGKNFYVPGQFKLMRRARYRRARSPGFQTTLSIYNPYQDCCRPAARSSGCRKSGRPSATSLRRNPP